MIYLSQFSFPSQEQEDSFRFGIQRTCYDSWYPFGILSKNDFEELECSHITVLYGGNGSGKSTALNVISEKLGLERVSLYNRSSFFEDYLEMCSYEVRQSVPKESCIITSDDVFDFMMNLRCINNGIDLKREEMFNDYLERKHTPFRLKSIADYEELKKTNLARSKSQSRYIRETVMDNVREHSNGESAFLYFADKIKQDCLYLLDEPENSLSAKLQQELLRLIEDSVRFYGCQFLIATHSPFLLALHGAKIYDLDAEPVTVRKWTELESVRIYYEFFKSHGEEFE